jgi:hypothetical protein
MLVSSQQQRKGARIAVTDCPKEQHQAGHAFGASPAEVFDNSKEVSGEVLTSVVVGSYCGMIWGRVSNVSIRKRVRRSSPECTNN